MALLEKIMIPYIMTEEGVLLEYGDVKELKYSFSKVKKIKNFYILYSYDADKTIDAVLLWRLVRFFYKNRIFYFLEKSGDKIYMFGGQTFEFSETVFFYKEFEMNNVEQIKTIDLLNKTTFNTTNKSVIFFINFNKEEKEFFLKELDGEEGNIRKILFWIFEGNSLFAKYRPIFLSLTVGGVLFLGTNYLLKQKEEKIQNQQQQIKNYYSQKIAQEKKMIAKIEKTIKKYTLPQKIKIYYNSKN